MDCQAGNVKRTLTSRTELVSQRVPLSLAQALDEIVAQENSTRTRFIVDAISEKVARHRGLIGERLLQ